MAVGDDVFLVLYFIGRNVKMGLSVSALNSKLMGLAFLFKLIGRTNNFLVGQALKGYSWGWCPSYSRCPVSFELLGSLFQVLLGVCSSEYEALLFQAAFSLAFFGALHIRELVSNSKKGSDGLQVGDVECSGVSLVFWIRKSKTDQAGRGSWVELFGVEGSPACPMQVVSRFLESRLDGSGSFLLHANSASVSVHSGV